MGCSRLRCVRCAAFRTQAVRALSVQHDRDALFARPALPCQFTERSANAVHSWRDRRYTLCRLCFRRDLLRNTCRLLAVLGFLIFVPAILLAPFTVAYSLSKNERIMAALGKGTRKDRKRTFSSSVVGATVGQHGVRPANKRCDRAAHWRPDGEAFTGTERDSNGLCAGKSRRQLR